MTEVKEKVEGSLKILIIGNKTDLKDERKISIETALHKARQFNVPLMETSALDSTNIKKAFESLLREMYKEFKKEKSNEKEAKKNKEKAQGVSLETEIQKEKGCC